MTNDPTAQRPLLKRPLTWIIVAAAAIVVVVSLVLTFATHPTSTTAGHTPMPSVSPSATGIPPAPTPTPQPTSPIPRGAPPVALTATPQVSPGVTVTIAHLKAVQGTAENQGDVAGPAIQVTMSVHNGSTAPINFNTTVVSLYYTSSLTPGLPLPGPGGKLFTGALKPGATATGVYVFGVPTASRSHVTISFDFSTSHPVLVFQGAAPTS